MSINYTQKKVFVGLSGGVDSAVSAALLKKEGYDVMGVFIKAWTPEGYPCTWKEDRRSAMRAAAVLDIPFITLDLEKEYKKEVVDYMIDEYKKGRTPNPDVMCNKEIKFGHFLKFALKNGADFIATGHYAISQPGKSCMREYFDEVKSISQAKDKIKLLEGADKNKDQSYFLWTLTQDQLKHTLFPIGHLQKSEVRKLAEKFGLPQATRKDSQGLCFLGKIDMKEFLKDYLKPKKGDVLNTEGEVIGEHDGAVLFTLGERHGFKVFNRQTESAPMYVVAKDIKKNTITVSSNHDNKPKQRFSSKSPRVALSGSTRLSSENFASASRAFRLENINLNSEIDTKNLTCRYRYRQEKISCELNGDTVAFKNPQPTATPGQSIVFYAGEKCIGGAIIAK